MKGKLDKKNEEELEDVREIDAKEQTILYFILAAFAPKWAREFLPFRAQIT